MQRPLLTIHGVGTLGNMGGWEESILKVISPHFECREIKYPQFRWMGLLVSIIEPWVFFPGLVILGMINRYAGRFKSIWLWLIAAIVLLFSFGAIFFRRRFELEHFVKPMLLFPGLVALGGVILAI